MSSSAFHRPRKWYLHMPLALRNNATTFVLGESSGGTGFKFDEPGILTRLSVQGEIFGVTGGPGNWTVDVTVYSDGVAAGNLVYTLAFTGTIAGVFGSTDLTAGAGGAGYGTGTDLFCKGVSALGGFATIAANLSITLEGQHLG